MAESPGASAGAMDSIDLTSGFLPAVNTDASMPCSCVSRHGTNCSPQHLLLLLVGSILEYLSGHSLFVLPSL